LLCLQDDLFRLANKIQHAGLQLIIHAVGDQAVQEAVNIMRRIDISSTVPRPRIEQAAVLNQQLLCGIKEIGVSVSIQPCVVASEFSVWSAEKRLGEKRVRWLFPVKDLLGCGVLVSAGSDCPMEPLNPLLGVEAAASREGIQKTSVFEALQMYTISAAQTASIGDADKGSIESGKLADFTVLSHDPTSVNVDVLSDSVSVCFTVLGGVVYRSKN
jgi:predicted amidohydrolase YtcJ